MDRGFPRKKIVFEHCYAPQMPRERVCSVCSVSSLRHEWWLSSRKSITFDQILGYLLLRQTNKKPNTWLPHPTSLHPRRPPIHLLPLARRDVPRRVDGWIPNIGWMTRWPYTTCFDPGTCLKWLSMVILELSAMNINEPCFLTLRKGRVWFAEWLTR